MDINKKIIGSHLYMVDEIGSTNKELLEHVDKYETRFTALRKKANRR